MGTLLIDRTTNQPRSVHSGRGGSSIAQGGWEAKSPVMGDLEMGVSIRLAVSRLLGLRLTLLGPRLSLAGSGVRNSTLGDPYP